MASQVEGGHVYPVGGIQVHFPYKAYGTQLSMISRMIQGLEKGQNCLLESPTGSGKSLALLCAALGWQSAQYEKTSTEDNDGEHGSEYDCCCACHRPSNEQEEATTSAVSGVEPATTSADSNEIDMVTGDGPDVTVSAVDDKDDSGDEFKQDNKSFRTPVAANSKKKRPHLGIQYEDDDDDARGKVNGDWSSKWQMLLTNNRASDYASKLEAKQKVKCTCSCEDKESMSKAKKKKTDKIPTIWFGTRTHKQIAQIVRELKKTAYKHTRMCILASREHTCIHQHISKLPNKNEECKNARELGGCKHFDYARKIQSNEALHDVGLDSAWDIEEFVKACSTKKACPYYVSHQIREGADIIFCPYNYLIDPIVRSQMELSLKGHIIILDEAHNIEDSAREAASFKFSRTQLEDARTDLDNMVKRHQKPNEHQELSDTIIKIMDFIDNNGDNLEKQSFEQFASHWSGHDLTARLRYMGLSQDEFQRMGAICQDIWAEENDPREKFGKDFKLKSATGQLLEAFLVALGFIYREDMRYMDDYRMALVRNTVYRAAPTNNQWLNRNRRLNQAHVEFTLNFWCMNPAVAFRDASNGVHSIILTSGTLSPMDSFQSELGVPFAIQLEANHVIGKKQVFVGAISAGPTGQTLNATFQYAETYAFQDELGKLVLQTCQAVPHGVLCFFPSYRMLEKLSSRWQETGLWDKMSEKKAVLSESRTSADFEDTIRQFYDVISDTEDTEDCDGITGALFLAVCRGKVSEGLDFTDNNARAVITVGIPFPNVKDLQVGLKRKYNDQHTKSRGLLSGAQWYEIQAYRALNQALGRCIRHQFDWGALILVDERFSKNPKHIRGLSKWVRQRTVQFQNFRMAESQLQDFIMDRLSDPAPVNTSVNNSFAPATPCTTSHENTRQHTSSDDTSILETSSIQAAVTPASKVHHNIVTTPVANHSPAINGVKTDVTNHPVSLPQTLPPADIQTNRIILTPVRPNKDGKSMVLSSVLPMMSTPIGKSLTSSGQLLTPVNLVPVTLPQGAGTLQQTGTTRLKPGTYIVINTPGASTPQVLKSILPTDLKSIIKTSNSNAVDSTRNIHATKNGEDTSAYKKLNNSDVKPIEIKDEVVDLTAFDDIDAVPCTPPLFDSEEVVTTTIESKEDTKQAEIELSGSNTHVKADTKCEPVIDKKAVSVREKLQKYSFQQTPKTELNTETPASKLSRKSKRLGNQINNNANATEKAEVTSTSDINRADDEGEGTESIIRTRRSGRKRCSVEVPGCRKKIKTQDFLTDIDADTVDGIIHFKCQGCSKVLGKVKDCDVQYEKCSPGFMKNVYTGATPRGGFSVFNKGGLEQNMITLEGEGKSGARLNSFYSSTDHCCVVYLTCAFCKTQKPQAVQIVATEASCKKHKDSQVWWIP